jgi:class 3 adenylate cyclase
MFARRGAQMLASMRAIDLTADAPLLTWNEQSVGELPTGTVTLLLADVEGSTRLFISPRTVQSHLTHVYTKLAVSSRVQLVQEAGRHTRQTRRKVYDS